MTFVIIVVVFLTTFACLYAFFKTKFQNPLLFLTDLHYCIAKARINR